MIIKTTGVEDYLDSAGEATIKALILGEPSAGKTRSASFWPRPIFADCEGGLMSVADRKVPYATIKKTSDMEALLRQLDTECKLKVPAERRFQTLVIDTLDSYQRIVIQEILTAGRKEAMSGWQDWGQLDAKMTALVAKLHQLPMNIVVNVHVKATKDGDDGPLILAPKLKGDLREQIAAEFDLVGHMATFWEAVNGERTLKRAIKWSPEPNFPILKDRSGQLPRFTDVDFTASDYANLFEAIFGGDHFEELPQAEDVDVVPEPELGQVDPPPGGPVPVKAAAKKAAPAKKAAAEPTPSPEAKARPVRRDVPASTSETGEAPRATPAQPAPEAAAPSAAEPQSQQSAASTAVDDDVRAGDAEPDMDQAVATVADGLGGQVVSEQRHAEPVQASISPAASATDPLPCGTGSKLASGVEPVPGCGRDLRQMGDIGDMANIALIKTKTYLCPDCFGAWRRDHK